MTKYRNWRLIILRRKLKIILINSVNERIWKKESWFFNLNILIWKYGKIITYYLIHTNYLWGFWINLWFKATLCFDFLLLTIESMETCELSISLSVGLSSVPDSYISSLEYFCILLVNLIVLSYLQIQGASDFLSILSILNYLINF